MICDESKRKAIEIAWHAESSKLFGDAICRKHNEFTDWLRWQIEKREMRLDTIRLIGKSGEEGLATEAAKTAGEAAAFRESLAYIKRGWRRE